MATYRLVWSGNGALDLSQVLDTRGRPIVLSAQDPVVSISEATFKNPYVQRYLGPALRADLLDGPKPVMSPSPVLPKPEKATLPVSETIKSAETVIVETVASKAQDDIMTKETLAETPVSAEPSSPSAPPSLANTEGTESKGGFKGRKSNRK